MAVAAAPTLVALTVAALTPAASAVADEEAVDPVVEEEVRPQRAPAHYRGPSCSSCPSFALPLLSTLRYADPLPAPL